MKMQKQNIKVFAAAASFVLAALGAKVSLAYWASSVIGNGDNSAGTVNAGSWDRYTTGTPISSCIDLRSMLTSKTSSTFHLTTDLSCPTENYLGTNNRTFSGIFYGNGFTISDILNTNGRLGLFTTISGATIQNLILNNVNISGVSSGPAGILAGTSTSSNTSISRVRIYNSSVYGGSINGAGGIIGRATAGVTLSNIMLQNVIISDTNTSTSSGAGGIIGKMSAAIDISDVYVEGALSSPYNSGGLVGLIESAGALTVNRAITYANTSFRATSGNAGGVVGRNNRSGAQSLTDVFYTGAIYGASTLAGTLYTGTAMTYSNAWAAQWSWDNTPTITYSQMTGVSAANPANYMDYRNNLDTSWWSTSLPNIASSGFWTYDTGTYLYELKPKV